MIAQRGSSVAEEPPTVVGRYRPLIARHLTPTAAGAARTQPRLRLRRGRLVGHAVALCLALAACGAEPAPTPAGLAGPPATAPITAPITAPVTGVAAAAPAAAPSPIPTPATCVDGAWSCTQQARFADVTAYARRTIGAHGYLSVTETVESHYELIKQILQSYGVQMTRKEVREGLERLLTSESAESPDEVLLRDVPRRNLHVA